MTMPYELEALIMLCAPQTKAKSFPFGLAFAACTIKLTSFVDAG